MRFKLAILIILFVSLIIGCTSAKTEATNQKSETPKSDQTTQDNTTPPPTTEGRDIPAAWKLGDAAPIEKVKIVTSDKVEIVANFRPSAGAPSYKIPAVVCVPMLGKTKETYDEFTAHLSEIGIASLAIDVRGHGESTMGGTLRYGSFKPKDWQDCIKDINAAFGWLSNRNDIDKRHIGLVGASIGANFVLIIGAREEVSMVVALSPGMDYHGVAPRDAASKIKGKPVYLAATKGDKYSADSVNTLLQSMDPSTTMKIIDNRNEHGTNMFQIPFFQEELIKWMKEKFDAMVRDELNIDNAPKKGKPGAITVPK